MISRDDAVEAYIIALRIITEWGAEMSGEECAQIAWRGETGDTSWLLSWEAPEQ